MSSALPSWLSEQRRPVRQPGLALFPAGTERHVVRGGGLLALLLSAGDEFEVVDPEGLQSCELVPLDRDGGSDPGWLGAASSVPADGTRTALAGDAEDALRTLATLRRAGLDIERARAVTPFAAGSPAGTRARFDVDRDLALLVCAPGDAMSVHEQNPATDLLLWVKRATAAPAVQRLPEPLAEPLKDMRIERATATAYEVRAGEFIQVIDVEGRQCSDFQAFPLQNMQSCLDATVTRSLQGAAYPQPGLQAKFFDERMQPLVEFVRDTCGRHDTFGVACSARYYDDMGYPGHVNCSENFNTALSPYGIAPRAGWMALNLFFNTAVDDLNVFAFGEPWSRPGDYVLMRALTDLVCVTSACPCDIDAANGWNPTDIHLRTYAATHSFKPAIAYRMTTDAEPKLTRETPFHPRTSEHTRRFAEYKGFWLPTSYTAHGAVEEYWACREGVAVMDLSPLRKFEVLGPDAESLLQWALTRDVRRLAVGQVVYSAMCYEHGGMIDDGTLLRLGQDNFRWVGGDDYSGIWLREQAEKRGLEVHVKSSSEQMCNIAVQGPKSREVLSSFVWTAPAQPSIEELGWFRFTIARIGDFQGIPLVVSRTGYTGELGYEIWCHPRDAVAVWDVLWQAGKPHGLTPLGLEALDMLRIEAGLIFAGYEFDDQTDPFEAGIPFAVPLKTQNEDFCGRAALEKRKASPQRKLVGLEIEGDEMAANGDCVHVGRPQIGVITSGTRSPTLAKNIALCRIAIEHAEPGTEVEVGKIDGHQKRLAAKVVPLSFYDPKKERVRA